MYTMQYALMLYSIIGIIILFVCNAWNTMFIYEVVTILSYR